LTEAVRPAYQERIVAVVIEELVRRSTDLLKRAADMRSYL